MILFEVIENRCHAAATVDSGADKNADLIEKPCVKKSRIDRSTADDFHTLYIEFRCQNISRTRKIDFVLSAGDPRNMLLIKIIQVTPL